MNYQKYLTASLYAIQVPISVWAGFNFGSGNYIFGIILTAVLMVIEIAAVITWMNAQTIELSTKKRKQRK